MSKVSLFGSVSEVLQRNVSLTYAEIEVRIEELEGALFIHGFYAKFLPFVANAYGS